MSSWSCSGSIAVKRADDTDITSEAASDLLPPAGTICIGGDGVGGVAVANKA